MFLTSSNLSCLPGISHGFFTRNDGVSTGIYQSLNCGAGTKDATENVHENRKRVAAAVNTQEGNLVSLHQVHGDVVVNVTTPWDMQSRPQADAMVTSKRGIALGILTADCVPVLFADKQNGIIGAAHAGWKGAFGGVVEQTLKSMQALGAQLEHIAAAIGPAIGHQSYQVGAEFRDTFIQRSPANDVFFTPSSEQGYFLFNIKGFVRKVLADSNVLDVNTLANDTYLEEGGFFSYRRATHRKEADYGRQISVIMLNP